MISMFGAKTIFDENKVAIRVKMSYDALYKNMFHHFGSYTIQRNWFLVDVFLYIWGLSVYRDSKSRFPVIRYIARVNRASEYCCKDWSYVMMQFL